MGFLVGYHSFGHGETSGCFHGLGQNELEVITVVKVPLTHSPGLV